MDVKIDVDKRTMRVFENRIGQLIAITGKPVEEVLKQQGKLFAVSAAKHTLRYGDKAGVGKKHKADVEKTIRSTYMPIGGKGGFAEHIEKYRSASALKQWRSAVRSKNVAKIEALSRKLNLTDNFRGKKIKFIKWDGGAAHTKRLKGKGHDRVNVVLGPAKQINQFIREKKAQVGAAKAGWAYAARMLGQKGTGRGMPAYFAKGHRTRGFGRVKGSGFKSQLTVAHYGNYGFSKTDMDGIWKHRTKMMIRDINQQMRSAHKKVSKGKNITVAEIRRAAKSKGYTI